MKDFVIQYAEWKKECLKSIRKKTSDRNIRGSNLGEMIDRDLRLIDAWVELYKENPTQTEYYLRKIVEHGSDLVVRFERENEKGERK